MGVGSGIGAIFGAPLGGAVLAAEIVYREDFEYSALIPGFFASVVAYVIFGAFFGYHPLFAVPGGYHFEVVQLVWFALIGTLSGGIGRGTRGTFYAAVLLSARLPFRRQLRPVCGAVFVGLLALWLPEVLGTGYGWVQKGLSDQLLHMPLYVVLLLPLARIVATALSIGTGGSGGVLAGMVIGAFTGLAVWRLLEPFAPGVGHEPAAFIVVGMMAVFGGIALLPPGGDVDGGGDDRQRGPPGTGHGGRGHLDVHREPGRRQHLPVPVAHPGRLPPVPASKAPCPCSRGVPSPGPPGRPG